MSDLIANDSQRELVCFDHSLVIYRRRNQMFSVYAAADGNELIKHDYELIQRIHKHQRDFGQDVGCIIQPTLQEEEYLQDGRIVKRLTMVAEAASPLKNASGELFGSSLGWWLNVAYQLSVALEAMHESSVVHCDINPSNIYIRPDETLFIGCFRSAMLLDTSLSITARKITTAPAYLSPEQTGRTSRLVDYRTDFYSLGVTLYELLMKQLPFYASDVAGWIYAHIAKKPQAPCSKDANIPVPLSKIIMKLMAKNPSERYQSAAGLKRDIVYICKIISGSGGLDTAFAASDEQIVQALNIHFSPGRADYALKTFLVCEKLYDRADELKALQQAFINLKDSAQLVFISGSLGSGRARLVNEMIPTFAEHRTLFTQTRFYQRVTGSGEQGGMNVFFECVKRLIFDLANGQDSLYYAVSTKIRERVEAKYLRTLKKVIPEIEKLIEVSDGHNNQVDPQYEKNLLFEGLAMLMKIFTEETFVAMYFGDAQWADEQFFTQVKQIFVACKHRRLLLMFSLRNDAYEKHTQIALDWSEEFKHHVTNIRLKNLTELGVQYLLADTLHVQTAEVKQLAELVMENTNGNPLYIHTLLKELYQANFLRMEKMSVSDSTLNMNITDTFKWRWSLERIRARLLSSNLLERIISSIKNTLPPESNEILMLAAFVGHTFTLKTIAIVSKKTLCEVASLLWPAVEIGALLTVDDKHQIIHESLEKLNGLCDKSDMEVIDRFIHEDVRKAAYELSEPAARAKIHYDIGASLMAHNVVDGFVDDEALFFTAVDQMNAGMAYCEGLDGEEGEKVRTDMAQFNLSAADFSMQSMDFTKAKAYTEKAFQILSLRGEGDAEDFVWEKYYELSLDVSKMLAMISNGIGNFEFAMKVHDTHRKRAKTVKDRMSLQKFEVTLLFASARSEEVVKRISADLAELGCVLLATKEERKIDYENAKVELDPDRLLDTLSSWTKRDKALLDEDSEEELVMQSLASIQIAFTLVNDILSSSYCTSVYLRKILAFGSPHVRLAETLLSYLSRVLDKADTQRYKRFISVVDELVKKYPYDNTLDKARFHLIYYQTADCMMSLRERDDYLRRLIILSKDSGSLGVFTFAVVTYLTLQFDSGYKVNSVLSWAKQQLSFFKKGNSPLEVVWNSVIRWLTFASEEEDPIVVQNMNFELDKTPEGREKAMMFYVSNVYILLNLIFGKDTPIVKSFQAEDTFTSQARSRRLFYWSIYRCRMSLPEDEKAAVITEVEQYVKEMSSFFVLNPSIIGARYYLSMGEFCRIKGQKFEALKNYEKGVALAIESRCHSDEAIGHELLAKFWIGNDCQRPAYQALDAAIYAYRQWGLHGKAAKLEHDFKSVLLSGTSAIRSTRFRSNTVSSIPGDTNGSLATSPTSGSMDYDSTTLNSPSPTRTLDEQIYSEKAVDASTLLKVASAISSETNLEKLLNRLIVEVATNAGADVAMLILRQPNGNLMLQAEFKDNPPSVNVLQRRELPQDVHESTLLVPMTVIRRVLEQNDHLIIDDAFTDSDFSDDDYIRVNSSRSILCIPVLHKNEVRGLMYLENSSNIGAFTRDRLEIVRSLSSAAIISIENFELQSANSELKKALRKASTQSMKQPSSAAGLPKYVIDAPIRQALDSLKDIAKKNPDMHSLVENVAKVILTGQGVFSSNLDNIKDEAGQGIDQDTKDWIQNTLMMPARAEVIADSTMNLNAEDSAEPGVKLTDRNPVVVRNALQNYLNPNFDMFAFERLTNGKPLSTFATYVFSEAIDFNMFKIDPRTVKKYFTKIEQSYRDNPYHNRVHGADVLQTSLAMIYTVKEFAQQFTKLEMLAMVIAAAVHDVDHPGQNNNFLIQAKDPLAVLYSDHSVLEFHHCATAFSIALNNVEANIFESLTDEQYRVLRKMIVSLVLATDMAKHFEYINKFKAKFTGLPELSPAQAGEAFINNANNAIVVVEDPADRFIMLEMAMKLADLNNAAKHADQSLRWTAAIMEEFYQQGDKERSRGLPISKYMDRDDPNVPKCQIGFIDVLVIPLFDAWRRGIGETEFMRVAMKNIARNRNFWEKRLKKKVLDVPSQMEESE